MLTSILIAGSLLTGVGAHLPEYSTDSLEAVIFSADKGITVSHRDTISSESAISFSEALTQCPSLQITDNGGIGGLKTVSLRGMGSSHTAIYIDGVRAENVQSGQNDLGMFDIAENSIVIDYSQNSININTSRPRFDKGPVAGKACLSAGSFGTWLPLMRMDFRLSQKLSLSANASGVFSKGDFIYGEGQRRKNNDVAQARAGVDLFGTDDNLSYHIKAFYNDSRRGTPGSLSWPSDDRQADMNTFVQGRMKWIVSDLYKMNVSVKGGYDRIFYSSSWGDSRYAQTNTQLNTVHEFNIRKWCRMSAAADIHWTDLNSSSYNISRLSSLAAVAARFDAGIFSADIALEYCLALDKGQKYRDSFSPSANIRLRVVPWLELNTLCRRMYRIPVFNELYYAGYGNPELKPEDAWMSSTGLDFRYNIADNWTIKAGLDGFYTLLTDKITSIPSEADPNIWLPVNIGKVRSAGLDSNAGAEFRSDSWHASINTAYSFLSSIDRTPDSHSFGQQVPYTARHSLTTSGKITWKGWSLGAVWNVRCGYHDTTGEQPDWNTLDLTLSKELNIKKAGTFIFKCFSKNLSDFRYELASGYPMPGRSIMGGIEYKF